MKEEGVMDVGRRRRLGRREGGKCQESGEWVIIGSRAWGEVEEEGGDLWM